MRMSNYNIDGTYTPDTQDMEDEYAFGKTEWSTLSVEEARAEFQRGMAERDREVRAQAMEGMAARVRAAWAADGERCPWVGALDDEAARIRRGDA